MTAEELQDQLNASLVFYATLTLAAEDSSAYVPRAMAAALRQIEALTLRAEREFGAFADPEFLAGVRHHIAFIEAEQAEVMR